MKKLSITLLLIITVFSSCDKTNSETFEVDYQISLNEQFQLDLVSNHSTGYSWKWTNKQTVTIVDSVDCSYVCDTPVTVGSGGKEIWNFKGIKSGVDTIKLAYCHAWDSNSTVDSKKIVVKVK
jgi:predicted secreted protein